MFALLSPRLWIGLALAGVLAFTHLGAYRSGRGAVRVLWDKERAELTAQALAASEAARAKEKTLVIANQKVSEKYAKQKKANSVLAANLNDSVRQLQAILAGPVGADAATPTRDYGRGGLERELLGDCSKNLAEMAITADRLESKVVALQDYVKSVTQAK